MPFDGNCFVTVDGWTKIMHDLRGSPRDVKYFIVPMARLTENALALDPTYQPESHEEPQVVFRNDADELFDITMRYGRRPKVRL